MKYKPLLQIVKTDADPAFITPEAVSRKPYDTDFDKFRYRVGKQTFGFGLPILVITDEGFATPCHGDQESVNKIALPDTTGGIYELILDCVEGRGAPHLPEGIEFKINVIVDFTDSSPELLRAYEQLKDKYNVHEVNLIDEA